MNPAVSHLPRQKTITVEQSEFDRLQSVEQTARADRLDAADIAALRFLWGELESLVGLRSSLGGQMDRCAAGVIRKEDRAVAPTWWCARTRDFVEPDEDHEACVDRHTRAAHGTRRETMLCNASEGGCIRRVALPTDADHRAFPHSGEKELVTAPFPAEQWAFGNRALQRKVRDARATLLAMVRDGDGASVAVLFLLYREDAPPSEFPQFDELAPLVCDAPAVVEHAEALTRRLRAALGHAGDRHETVTARTAAHDLLDRRVGEGEERKRVRKELVDKIRGQCSRLAKDAAASFRAHKGGR